MGTTDITVVSAAFGVTAKSTEPVGEPTANKSLVWESAGGDIWDTDKG